MVRKITSDLTACVEALTLSLDHSEDESDLPPTCSLSGNGIGSDKSTATGETASNGAGSSGIEFSDTDVKTFADDVNKVLAHQEILTQIVAECRQSQFQGGNPQSAIEALFDEFRWLHRVSFAAYSGILEPLSQQAVSSEALTEDQYDEFLALWSGGLSWIAEAIPAYEHSGPQNWTHESLKPVNRAGDLYFNHQLFWGVNHVHNIHARPERLFTSALGQLTKIVDTLSARAQHTDGQDEALQRIATQHEVLSELGTILAQLDATDSDAEESQNQDGESRAAASDANLAKMATPRSADEDSPASTDDENEANENSEQDWMFQ